MIDIKFIRNYPDKVKEGCQKKQVKVDIDRLLEVDKKRREVLQALEDMRAQKNKANKEIQKAKDQKEPASAKASARQRKQKIILKMRELDKNSDRLTKNSKKLDEEFNNLMLQIPNLPFDDVPLGRDERDNVVLREVGEKPKFDLPAGRQGFQPKDYLEIAENLDLIDVKRAAKVAGPRFGYIKKEAVLLEFALINFAFDALTKEGFILVLPPVMLKSEMAKGTGYFEAADIEDAYFLPKDNLF